MAQTNLDILIKAKDQASKVVDALDERINNLVESLGSFRDNLNFEGGVNKFRELKGSAEDLEGSIDNASESAKQLSEIDLDGPVSAFERLGQANDKLNSGLTIVAEKLRSLGASLLLFSAGVTAGTTIAANSFLSFNEAIAEVTTLVDSAVISNEELENTVLDLSNSFGIASEQVAAGLYTAISSGATAGAEANQVLNASLALSVAGLVDAETAVNGVTTVLNAFALSTDESERVADGLFKTMQLGKTTVGELSSFIFQAGPIAAALGVSFEELAAAAGTLTTIGTPTAGAFTQIRAAIAGLARPTDELKELFKDLGGAEKAIADVGLAEVFNIVTEATGGTLGQIQKLVGSIEGANAILALGGKNAEEFARQIKEIEGATGSLAEGLGKIQSQPFFELAKASTQVLNAFRELGRIGLIVFVPVFKVIGIIANAIGDFARANKILSASFVLLTGLIITATGAALAFGVSTTIAAVALVGLTRIFPSVFLGFTSITKALIALTLRTLQLVPGMTFLTTKVKGLGVALRSAFILGGVLLGVIAIASAMSNLNTQMEKTEKLLERNRRRLNELVNNNVIRSTAVLVAKFRELGEVSRSELIAFQRELKLRQKSVEIEIESKTALIQATNGLTEKLFGNVDTKGLADQLDVLEDKSAVLTSVLGELESQLGGTASGITIIEDEVEDLIDTFDELSTSANAFISDLKLINKVEFNELEANLKRQGDLRLELLRVGGAGANVLIDAEIDNAKRLLIIRENRVKDELAIEQKRVEDQKRLIEKSAGDEEDAARRLQELASASISAQVKAAVELAGIRQEIIDVTKQQLGSLAVSAIEAKNALKIELKSIDDEIRKVELRGLTEQERNAKIATEIVKTNAAIDKSIRDKTFNETREQLIKLKNLIKEQDVTPETASGFQLETTEATAKRTIGLFEELQQKTKDLASAEAKQRAEVSAGLKDRVAEQKQSLENIKTELSSLEGLSAEVNIRSNFADQVGLIDKVSNSLANLQGSAATVSLDVVVNNDVLEFLEGGVINIPVEGLNQLSNVANQFESSTIRVLEEVRKTVDSISSLTTNVGKNITGFAGGGGVTGPGTSTSDSILARLSKGEFVMPADIVKKFGFGFFENIRRGQIPVFAEGGAVGLAPQPKGIEDIVTIRLQLGRNNFDLKSDRDTARNLTKAFKNLESGLVGG